MRKANKNPELIKTRKILSNHLRMIQSITKATNYKPEDKKRNICMHYGWILGYYAGKGFSEYKLHICYAYINKCLDKVNKERIGTNE